MSFSTHDISAIKWSLLACLLSTGFAVGVIQYSAGIQQKALRDLQQAQKQLTDARNQLNTAQSDLENMSAYQLEYDALVAQKVIGNEQRLDWIEGLENLRKQGLVPTFKYNIAPQKAYAPNPPLTAGNFALSMSPVSMQIDLLHEGQLMTFLGALNTQIPGWFLLDGCSMARNANPESGGIKLRSDCSGGWFTMKNRSAP